MCTCITLENSSNSKLLARTMDFSFELDPDFVFIPRNYPLKFKHLKADLNNHYAFGGLSAHSGNEYVFADGVNEYGLAAAALYFENYAVYEPISNSKKNIAAFELVNWLLATCKDLEDVINQLNQINLVNTHVELINKASPLHWMIADQRGNSIVVESLKEGLTIKNNPIGVLTNSPNLDWQLTNLNNYIGLNNKQTSKKLINDIEINAFGQGGGSFGLPGDYTSTSRFVKTVFNKLTCKLGTTEADLIVSAINILNSVSISKGNVLTSIDGIDYTQYTAYILLNSQDYYFKTYFNDKVRKVALKDFDFQGNQPSIKVLEKTPNFESL